MLWTGLVMFEISLVRFTKLGSHSATLVERWMQHSDHRLLLGGAIMPVKDNHIVLWLKQNKITNTNILIYQPSGIRVKPWVHLHIECGSRPLLSKGLWTGQSGCAVHHQWKCMWTEHVVCHECGDCMQCGMFRVCVLIMLLYMVVCSVSDGGRVWCMVCDGL